MVVVAVAVEFADGKSTNLSSLSPIAQT